MKYQKLIVFVFSLMLAGGLSAQTPRKPRPTKNPQQLPSIIGLPEAQSGQPAAETGDAGKSDSKTEAAGVSLSPQQAEQLVRAVEGLAGEVRGLVQEMRALNVRQQAQLDMLRLTRSDFRVDQYERELKTTRDRLAQLEGDEQQLKLMLKPESLEAQMRTVATLNKDETMRQIRANYEARLNGVLAEKELMQKREAEITGALNGYRAAIGDTEKKLDTVEEALRQLVAPAAQGQGEKSLLPAERKP